jgi:hypothetical protein
VRGFCGAAEDGTYKVLSRSGPGHCGKSEGLILLMMPKDSITSAEGRSPASVGRSSRGEGSATAAGKSLLAQRAIKKVRVLQETLYRAAKENPRRTFGVLYDKVCRWEVLWEAWHRVRRNRGAPGVDGRSIEAIKAQGEVAFIRDIQAALLAKQHRPRAVRRVFIPKRRGRFRALGIPVVQDRVIQGAVRLVIEPIFEANFCEGSYGFRPGRGCRDAIAAIRKWVTYGYSHVIDAEVKRWQGGTVILRWTAAGVLEAEHHFRKVAAYRALPRLAAVFMHVMSRSTVHAELIIQSGQPK